jgi:hypothetical protein
MYELATEDPFTDMLALNKTHNAQLDVTAHGFSSEYGKALLGWAGARLTFYSSFIIRQTRRL